MYAFAFAGAFRKIITEMGKRLASQFPNLGIILDRGAPRRRGRAPEKKKKEAQGDKETAEPATAFGHTGLVQR